MTLSITKKSMFSGWTGAIILMVLYFSTEIGFVKVGANLGAFLYVTFHFIIMPLLSIFVIAITLRRIYYAGTMKKKFLLLSSLIIPALIIFIAVTGDTTLPRLLNVDFNR
jgi:uncharacterized membrane protein YhaH (DUF805 family)